jgi:hypothetical protein
MAQPTLRQVARTLTFNSLWRRQLPHYRRARLARDFETFPQEGLHRPEPPPERLPKPETNEAPGVEPRACVPSMIAGVGFELATLGVSVAGRITPAVLEPATRGLCLLSVDLTSMRCRHRSMAFHRSLWATRNSMAET